MNKPTKKFLYAQALAKKGFRIFPLEVNGKKPLHEGWQQEAAADASPWARGEDYNIGVATQWCPAHGVALWRLRDYSAALNRRTI